MPQVIEWRGAGPDDIVWRYPVEEITNAAQLVVHEYETAVFLRDGKAYDVFPPGRHTLTTLNLPLITSAYRIFFGGKTPFTATVIYVSTKQFAGKWGAKAQTTELAPLMGHGTACSGSNRKQPPQTYLGWRPLRTSVRASALPQARDSDPEWCSFPK